MIGCVKCFKPMSQVNSLHRINPKGEPGKWVCDQCISKAHKAALDKVVVDICEMLKKWKP